MFRRHANRMLRDDWVAARQLAQELFAIFSQGDLPLDHAGPITLYAGGDALPGLTFSGFGDLQTALRITRSNGPGIRLAPFQLDMGGGSIINANIEGGGASNIQIGTVRDGSGKFYNVVLDAGGLVRVEQLNATDDTLIPAQTRVVVFRTSRGYFIDVPVWL